MSRLLVEETGAPLSPVQAVVGYLIALGAAGGFAALSLGMAGIVLDFSFVGQFSGRIADGLALTLVLSACSLVGSLAIGVPVAVGRSCRVIPVRCLCGLYVGVVRGTPLLAQIYLFYYIVGTAWGVENRAVAGAIILSVFAGAYVAEIVRGGIASVDRGQIEAGRAVGFSRFQLVRYVIAPQVVARVLPALAGQFASIVKDSSLLSVISIIELTQAMREISATNFNLFGCYLLLAALYLAMTLPITALSGYFERRFDYAH